jgi:penicillin amidase
MRIIIDFADVEHALSINPTGQSGNFMSPHYKDQAEMFVDGKFRKQLMDKEIIIGGDKLIFTTK